MTRHLFVDGLLEGSPSAETMTKRNELPRLP
jgi:hypothetical protein